MVKHHQEEYGEQCGLPPVTAYYTIVESDISKREIKEEDAVRFEDNDMSREEMYNYLELKEVDPETLDNEIFTLTETVDKDYDGYLYFSEYLGEYLTEDELDDLFSEARLDFENHSEEDCFDPYDSFVDNQLTKDY